MARKQTQTYSTGNRMTLAYLLPKLEHRGDVLRPPRFLPCLAGRLLLLSLLPLWLLDLVAARRLMLRPPLHAPAVVELFFFGGG